MHTLRMMSTNIVTWTRIYQLTMVILACAVFGQQVATQSTTDTIITMSSTEESDDDSNKWMNGSSTTYTPMNVTDDDDKMMNVTLENTTMYATITDDDEDKQTRVTIDPGRGQDVTDTSGSRDESSVSQYTNALQPKTPSASTGIMTQSTDSMGAAMNQNTGSSTSEKSLTKESTTALAGNVQSTASENMATKDTGTTKSIPTQSTGTTKSAATQSTGTTKSITTQSTDTTKSMSTQSTATMSTATRSVTTKSTTRSMTTLTQTSAKQDTNTPVVITSTQSPQRICYKCSGPECNSAQTSTNANNSCVTDINFPCFISYNQSSQETERGCYNETQTCTAVNTVSDVCMACCNSDRCNSVAISNCNDLQSIVSKPPGGRADVIYPVWISVMLPLMISIRHLILSS